MQKEVEETSQNLFRLIYESAASDPRHWLGYARSLKLGASVLRPHFDNEPPSGRPERGDCLKPKICPVYLFLVGLAIENYAKAISVIHNPQVTLNGKLKRLKRHDLLGLLAEINFTISTDEKELVERLEQFVLWAGRYPVPTDAKNVYPKKRKFGQNNWLIYSLATDSIVSSELLDRLDEKVQIEMKNSLRHSG